VKLFNYSTYHVCNQLQYISVTNFCRSTYSYSLLNFHKRKCLRQPSEYMLIYVNGKSTQLTRHMATLLNVFNNPLYHVTYYQITAVCDNCVSLGCSMHLTLCAFVFVKDTHSRNWLFVIRTIQQSSNPLCSNPILNRYQRSFQGIKRQGMWLNTHYQLLQILR
jgi:hypothetical protein